MEKTLGIGRIKTVADTGAAETTLAQAPLYQCPGGKQTKISNISLINSSLTDPVTVNLYLYSQSKQSRLMAPDLVYEAGEYSMDDTGYTMSSGDSIVATSTVNDIVDFCISGTEEDASK